VKIGPVDTEIALLIVKKEKKEINASKIYSHSGKFAVGLKKQVIAQRSGMFSQIEF